MMFSLSTDSMEEQIALNKELQGLLNSRTQKLQELLLLEKQLENVSKSVRSVCLAQSQSEHDVERSSSKMPVTGEPHQPVGNNASAASVVTKDLSVYGRKGGLPFLIAKFLHNKPKGETKAAITHFCLQSGYKSDSSSFETIVNQTLYGMKRKNNIHRDESTRMWILD